MGESIEFASNGDTVGGHLSLPGGGTGRGIIVLQEWWGLVPQIKGVCDRLAGEGYVALAPDLFRGEIAQHDEMDKAGELMNTLPADRAGRDMGGAVDYLLGHEATTGASVGVVGFCMGGLLSMVLGAYQGDKVGAIAAYYGAPLGDAAPDWSGLTAPVLIHIAGDDAFFPPDAVNALADALRGMGKDVTTYVYPGTGHAFANEENALGTYDKDAGDLAWSRTLEFLKSKLAS
jgi:carboxymethylenebutenolidase